MNNNDIGIILSNSEDMSIRKARKNLYLFFKRFFDVLVGLIGIVFLIPLTIIIKILYILTGDFHSIFYSQERIGKNGKEFKMYKYRSMIVNADEKLKEVLKDKKLADEYKNNKKLENDPRITKVGKLIRLLSLDEFPQFINIFLGDMSLIGNRPYLPREKDDMGTFYQNIIKTKPGLSGYWQVNGRSNLSFKKRLELESYYSNNCSLLLDIKIFLKTFKIVISRKGSK